MTSHKDPKRSFDAEQTNGTIDDKSSAVSRINHESIKINFENILSMFHQLFLIQGIMKAVLGFRCFV